MIRDRLAPLALLAALLAAPAGCAATRARPAGPAPPPAEDLTFVEPDVSALEGWQGPDVEQGEAVPLGRGRAALLLTRRAGDRVEVALAVGRADGSVAGVSVLASVNVGGRGREVLTSLTRFPIGGERALRADVRVFDAVPPRYFAVKTVLVAVDDDRTRTLMDRLSESGDDVQDRRAVLAARDVDGDGQTEIVVEERQSGDPRARTLVYRRGPDGRFVTDGRSLFE